MKKWQHESISWDIWMNSNVPYAPWCWYIYLQHLVIFRILYSSTMEHIGIWLFSGSILLMVLPNQSSWQRSLSTCSATKSVELALHSKKIIQSYTWSLFSMLPWGKLTQMWKTNGVRFGKLCTNLVWWVKTTSLSRPYRRVLNGNVHV